MTRRSAPTRRGGVYLAVAGTVTFVTLIGVAGIAWWARADDRVSLVDDQRQAAMLARAGVELGIERIASDENWRKTFADGGWADATTFNAGSISLTLTDEADGRLEDDLNDNAKLRARSKLGRAARSLEVELEPRPVAIDALSTGIWAAGVLSIDNSVSVVADLPIYAADHLTAEDYYVGSDLQSSASVTTERGARSETVVGPDFYTQPDWDSFKEAIKTIGTEIPRSAFGSHIQNAVLSSASNPFGTPDPDGIYWISGSGPNDAFSLRNVRIVGTLIVFDADVRAEWWQLWEQTDNGWPVLVCEKKLTLSPGGIPLIELLAGFNANPIGTPYNGEEDNANDDTHPTRITGLVVGLEDITISGGLDMRGTIIAQNDVDITWAAIYVRDEPSTRENPPVGFRAETSQMRLVEGSWRWVAD
ncbi:MAG: hypothetical protein AAFP26_05720 [Planctomycetota bacterium]